MRMQKESTEEWFRCLKRHVEYGVTGEEDV